MIAATICSGIGAPEMAMPHWQWSFQSEIEAAPRAILKHRHRAQDARSVRADGPALWGDFTTIRVRHMRRLNVTLPEWIIAGTPCQAFSIAGLRQSMADDRGNLTLEFVRLVHALRRSGSLRGFTWENVPGVLSTRDNAFGCFLAAVIGADDPLRSPLKQGRWPSIGMASGPWARVAWRVLDAQYFGLAQRRKRVFVVADFGNGPDPAAVLFEPRRMSGNFAKGIKKRQVAPTIPSRRTAGGGLGTDFDCDGGLIAGGVSMCLNAHANRLDAESETLIPVNRCGFDGEAFSIMPMNSNTDYKARATDIAQPLMAGGPVGGNQGGDFIVTPFDTTQITSKENVSNPRAGDPCHPLASGAHVPAIAYQTFGDGAAYETGNITAPLRTGTGTDNSASIATTSSGVRRLTFRECCALQGFPRDYFDGVMLRGKQMADGPIYKCLGNSMAVPVLEWILERVERFMPPTETQPKPPRQPA